jgi:fructokinase
MTGRHPAVIVVAGEALVDLVVSSDGQVAARPGGGPYNAARTMARLGAATTFLGRLAGDGFGRLLRERLTGEGVVLGVREPSGKPSTLSVAALDEAGVASYSFYLDGTAALDLDYETLKAALPAGPAAVHVGTLRPEMGPLGAALERLVLTGLPADALVLLDPNYRPGDATDHEPYRRRLHAIARRADIVKASVEDLAYLCPDGSAEEAARALLRSGSPLVLVTDGPHPARAFLPDAVLSVTVPEVTVADTIGAGDAFGGGFLAWWTTHGFGRAHLHRTDLVGQALRAAVAVSALTCIRPGANPPTLAELESLYWWPRHKLLSPPPESGLLRPLPRVRGVAPPEVVLGSTPHLHGVPPWSGDSDPEMPGVVPDGDGDPPVLPG